MPISNQYYTKRHQKCISLLLEFKKEKKGGTSIGYTKTQQNRITSVSPLLASGGSVLVVDTEYIPSVVGSGPTCDSCTNRNRQLQDISHER